jgi:large subunit ribosomal protein L29
MNKAREFHNMTDVEIKEQIASLKNELFNLRFQHSTGQLKDPLQLNRVKKDIARVMTIAKERELNVTKNKCKTKKGSKA